MDDAAEPGAGIPIASVPNLRDVGGWPTRGGGRVRRGLLFRSTDLDRLAGADMEAFAGLGIRTVYDLRTAAARRARPDRLPAGTEQIACDVLADAPHTAPARIHEVMADPKQAPALFGHGRAEHLFEQSYREMVSLPSARTALRLLFSDLAEEQHRPALIHCTTGKDRTGWAAAALLTFLGVAEEDVMTDYMLTNEQLLPTLQPVVDRFRAHGGDPEYLWPVLGVRREYLLSALAEMRRRFGSIDGYLTRGLRIDADRQQRLKRAFIEPAAVE